MSITSSIFKNLNESAEIKKPYGEKPEEGNKVQLTRGKNVSVPKSKESNEVKYNKLTSTNSQAADIYANDTEKVAGLVNNKSQNDKGNIAKLNVKKSDKTVKFPFGDKIQQSDSKLIKESAFEIPTIDDSKDIAKEFNLKVISTPRKNDPTTPYYSKFTGDRKNIEAMINKYFSSDVDYNKDIKEEVDECNKTLTEGSERRATDDLLQAIEDGFVDEHTVLLACLKYMSEDDVKDMCHDNEFNIADDEDLEDGE